MDKGAMKEYRARWQAVNAFEQEERKKLSSEEKLEQLSMLIAMGPLLGTAPGDQAQEIDEVRTRWMLLRTRLRHV
ncbi:MAG: hypothetical protein AB2L14_01620 [Candidatus Xenobiia bacterium LiM19]